MRSPKQVSEEEVIVNEQERESNADLYRRRIQRLERLAWWMDEAFEIPFLKWRIGLDALFGFLPGFGDLVGAVIAVFVLLEAARLRVSGWILARMGMNVVLEFLVGSVPVVGDILDIHFKSNRRNVDLLKGAGASVMGESGPRDSMAKKAAASKWIVVSVFLLLILSLVGTTIIVGYGFGFLLQWGEVFVRQILNYFSS
ncbi:MAG: DUF4112 domain-containing protein [Bdellovibrionales bacterium]|nr:DUF4112 domain-containing protein [Bdellovibrionales bacterium]